MRRNRIFFLLSTLLAHISPFLFEKLYQWTEEIRNTTSDLLPTLLREFLTPVVFGMILVLFVSCALKNKDILRKVSLVAIILLLAAGAFVVPVTVWVTSSANIRYYYPMLVGMWFAFLLGGFFKKPET